MKKICVYIISILVAFTFAFNVNAAVTYDTEKGEMYDMYCGLDTYSNAVIGGTTYKFKGAGTISGDDLTFNTIVTCTAQNQTGSFLKLSNGAQIEGYLTSNVTIPTISDSSGVLAYGGVNFEYEFNADSSVISDGYKISRKYSITIYDYNPNETYNISFTADSYDDVNQSRALCIQESGSSKALICARTSDISGQFTIQSGKFVMYKYSNGNFSNSTKVSSPYTVNGVDVGGSGTLSGWKYINTGVTYSNGTSISLASNSYFHVFTPQYAAPTCESGQYLSGSTCTSCPSGYTASDSGATSSSKCYMNVTAEHYVKTANASSSTACAAGTTKAAHKVYYGSTSSCSACSNNSNVAEWKNTGSCQINKCQGGFNLVNNACVAAGTPTCESGQYLSGSTCISCPSGYTASDSGATSSSKCYMNVSANHYVKTKNDATSTACAAGTTKAAHKVYYGSTSSCDTLTCTAGKYLDGNSCKTCPSGYTSAAGATSISKCYINVPAEKYIKTVNDSTPTACEPGTTKTAHTVYYGSTSSCGTCSNKDNVSVWRSGICVIHECKSGYYVSSNNCVAEPVCTEYQTLNTTTHTCDAIKVTVTFDPNGGVVTPTTKEFTAGGKYGTLPVPTYDDYKFDGWFTAKDSGTEIKATDTVSTTVTKVYAHYTKLEDGTVAIILDGNGATKNSVPTSILAYLNDTKLEPDKLDSNPERIYTISGFTLSEELKSKDAKVSSTDAVKDSYTFTGWYSASKNGIKVIDNNALVKGASGYTDKDGKWIKTTETTLYAGWEDKGIVVPTITKEGYTCGWTTDSNGKKIEYASAQKNVKIDKDLVLYGICEEGENPQTGVSGALIGGFILLALSGVFILSKTRKSYFN